MRLIVFVFIFLYPSINATEESWTNATDAIKSATVAVACVEKVSLFTNDMKLISIEGTGFFVSENGTFLTAGHVAHSLYLSSPPRTTPCQTPVIYFPQEGWKSGFNVNLKWYKIDSCYWGDDSLDLATCKILRSPFAAQEIKIRPVIVSFETSVQKEGTQVAFTGFPLQIAQPITAHGTVAGYLGNDDDTSPREVIIDHNNWPGASGGALYLSNGKVVGLILKRGLNDAVGLAFARSSSFIVEFLAKHKAEDKKK